MFTLEMVGKRVWFAVALHGERKWTEGKRGTLVKLAREGDEWTATVKTDEGLVKYGECDIVEVQVIRTPWEVKRERLAKYHSRKK